MEPSNKPIGGVFEPVDFTRVSKMYRAAEMEALNMGLRVEVDISD